jgi:hypothetical protein
MLQDRVRCILIRKMICIDACIPCELQDCLLFDLYSKVRLDTYPSASRQLLHLLCMCSIMQCAEEDSHIWFSSKQVPQDRDRCISILWIFYIVIDIQCVEVIRLQSRQNYDKAQHVKQLLDNYRSSPMLLPPKLNAIRQGVAEDRNGVVQLMLQDTAQWISI